MDDKNKFRKSRNYIKYSECRHLLRPAIELLGYKLDKEGSSARDLKYKSELFDDVVIVTASTNYELFFNPRSSERGDVVRFLQNRSGSTVNQFADFHANREFVDQKLREASNYTLRTEYVEQSTPRSVIKSPFIQENDRYNIEELPSTPDQLPAGVVNMLKRRGMNPDVFWDKEIRNSVGILWAKSNEKRIPNLVFLWKNPETGETVGAQYKFYIQDVVKKVFVKGSNRTNSLWMTDMTGKSALFVTEDVFDAVAHKLLTQDKSYGYCATGGSITPEQVSYIRNLAVKKQVLLVLGNDRDGAGMLSNLKIIADLQNYEYSKQDKTLRFTLADGTPYFFDYSESTESMIVEIRKLAAKKNILIEIPKFKDWNEDLKAKPSMALEALRKGQTPQINEIYKLEMAEQKGIKR